MKIQIYPVPPIEWNWLPDRRQQPKNYKAKVQPVQGKKLNYFA